MKRFKKVWILLGVLAVCCIAAFAVTRIEEHKEQIRNYEEVIIALPQDELQTISWDMDSSALSFHRDEDGIWKWDDDDAFPVNAEVLGEMVSIFESFTASFCIEQPEDIGQYGLDTPECTITLEGSTSSVTLTLGDFSKMDSQRYVSIGDGNVYLVTTDPMDTYDVELSSLIEHDTVPVFDTVDSITFTGDGGYEITYNQDAAASYCTDDIYFAGAQPLDTDLVETYLHNISYMGLADYVTYDADDEQLQAYGLDAPALTVTIGYTQDETACTFTMHVGLVTEETDDETTTTAYARVGDSKRIYKLATDDETAIFDYSYDDLRHKAAFTADFEAVTSLDITLDGSAYTLTSETDEEEQTVWYYEDAQIDIGDVQSALTSLWAEDFTQQAQDGQEEISVTLHLTSEYASTLQITIYRYDGAQCLCYVNGESFARISRSSAVDLIEAINAIILS